MKITTLYQKHSLFTKVNKIRDAMDAQIANVPERRQLFDIHGRMLILQDIWDATDLISMEYPLHGRKK